MMRFICYILSIAVFSTSLYAQQTEQKDSTTEATALFKDETVLKIGISYSKKDLLNDPDDPTYVPSRLSYEKKDGSLKTMATQIKARGNYRRSNCYYLPLWLKIDKNESAGTIFEEDKKLKVVLPCLLSSKSNDLIIKEFLAYKIYELLSPYHFDTKLLTVHLKENNKGKIIDHDLLGIFIQDQKKVASQNHGKMIKRHIHPNAQDPISATRNDLFQYMIGNTDFAIAYGHNEKLFYIDDKIVPIPYDFDMAGLVNASYAVVSAINNETLPITSVTQRLYRGFDRDDEVLQEVRRDFINREKDVMDLMDKYKEYFSDPREFKEAKDYIIGFYDVIKDDKKFERRILKKERTKLK